MGFSSGLDDQKRLVEALRDPAVCGAAARARLLETHISYVLLTGEIAYKIKKALRLAFLDFSTLEGRRGYCEEEIRLNRRFAPEIYLNTVRITGSIDKPQIEGDGPAIEYAVKMREFAQDGILARQLELGAVTTPQIDEMATIVADFHASADRSTAGSLLGAPEEMLRLVRQNFDQVTLLDAQDRSVLDQIRAWTERESAALRTYMLERKSDGFVRECHGDLHLGNIALVGGRVTMFDCIEFNDAMRWIDVMSDVAFVVMDLQDRGRRDFAARFLGTYLEHTGDYDGLMGLRFYVVYRAMVRAKVSALLATQVDAHRAASALSDSRTYLTLARDYTQASTAAIVIAHGLSGSGKSTFAQRLVEATGAIRIRTDVERKRLHSVNALERSDSALDGGLYAPAATEQVYRRVRALARIVARSGNVAVVDGAFLKRAQRDLLRGLATELAVPFAIVSIAADRRTLDARVESRLQRGTDASEADRAVLQHQMQTQEPLTPDEEHDVVHHNSTSSEETAATTVRALVDHLSRPR